MKTTCLVYRDTNAEKKELVIATKKEWDDIMAANRTLPREKRRFFIESRIREGSTWDRMFIETSKEEYDKWHSQEEMRRRNMKAAKKYKFLSLDYGCSFDDDVEYTETVADDSNVEAEVASDMLMHGEVRDDVATIAVEWIDPKTVPDMEVPETTYELLSDEDFEIKNSQNNGGNHYEDF